MKRNSPIGVFDSGLGGLTVVKELMSQLPNEDIVYFGDTARVPYGTKSRESIIRFSLENAEILQKNKVKMIVVACNSSSSYAIDSLREKCDVPIVGVIEAGVRGAIKKTKNNRIGVIATSATIDSRAYLKEIQGQRNDVSVFSNACPLFVPLVEEGWNNKAVTRAVALEYLSKLKKAKIDTLILGCTHYPLLKAVLREVMGSGVKLIDSAREVTLVVKDILSDGGQLVKRQAKGKCQVLVSDRPQRFEQLAKRFLGKRFLEVRRIENV